MEEIKNTGTEMKKACDEHTGRLDIAEERNCDQQTPPKLVREESMTEEVQNRTAKDCEKTEKGITYTNWEYQKEK